MADVHHAYGSAAHKRYDRLDLMNRIIVVRSWSHAADDRDSLFIRFGIFRRITERELE